MVLCLHPQHTPTPIHNKQNIPNANKSKNKNHNVAASSNNATTNLKLWNIHIPQKTPKAPSRNPKPYSTFQFHKIQMATLHFKYTKHMHEPFNFQSIFKLDIIKNK